MLLKCPTHSSLKDFRSWRIHCLFGCFLLKLITFNTIDVYLISSTSLAVFKALLLDMCFSRSRKEWLYLFFSYKVPPKIPCLDKCNRQQLVQSELLPDIFCIAMQTNLCRVQCTIHMILDAIFFFWWGNGWKFTEFSQINLFFKLLLEHSWRAFCLFVCLRHNLLLGSEPFSSAVADDRCHPAVLLCQQWLSVTPKAKFLVSAFEERKCAFARCSVSWGSIENLCSTGSRLRKMQNWAAPWQ